MKCSTCKPSLPCVSCISNAKLVLTSWADGPLTDFVIISRGCQLVVGGVSSEVAANAITESLQEYGFLPHENPVLMTGS